MTIGDNWPEWVGFAASGIAVIFFGSNFTVVKKFPTGDGMFFQWVLCTAIWFVAVVVNLVVGSPQFYPLAMLGGFFWATGNVCTVAIIKTVGLGIGMLVWSAFNLVAGWASGRFGLFGLKPDDTIENSALNYAGVGLGLISMCFYVSIKSEVSQPSENYSLLAENDSVNPDGATSFTVRRQTQTADDEDTTFLDNMPPRTKQIVGFVLAIFAGLLYGINFVPVIYIYENDSTLDSNGLLYVFSHFTGIYVTSTAYFLVYCAFMRNKPRVYPETILPAFVSGVMWAVADISWFVANTILSQAISFPIITTGPGIIAALWSVIVFKEIQGRRNMILLGSAFVCVIAGAILCAFSFKS